VKQAAEGEILWLNLRWPGQAPALALGGLHAHAAWALFDLENWRAAGEAPRPWPLPVARLSVCDGRNITVFQPYASIGGRARGSAGSADFWRDQAEELSHRGQAVLPRDYERLLLREFPEALAALCLPHTDEQLRRNRPGHCAVIVFAPQNSARLHQADGRCTLNPGLPAYADGQLLADMQKFLAGRASPLAAVHTLQANFQAVTPVLRASLDPWKNTAEARRELGGIFGRFLAPWAFAPGRAVFSRPLDRRMLEEELRGLPWLVNLLELDLLSAAPLAPTRPDVLFYMESPKFELNGREAADYAE
jgi:hypothetical protein